MTELILQNINEDLMHNLQECADQDGISVEQKVLDILQHHTTPSKSCTDDILSLAEQLRSKNAHINTTDSAILIREDRDR